MAQGRSAGSSLRVSEQPCGARGPPGTAPGAGLAPQPPEGLTARPLVHSPGQGSRLSPSRVAARARLTARLLARGPWRRCTALGTCAAPSAPARRLVHVHAPLGRARGARARARRRAGFPGQPSDADCWPLTVARRRAGEGRPLRRLRRRVCARPRRRLEEGGGGEFRLVPRVWEVGGP